MSLYTLKNKSEAYAPFQNYSGNNSSILNQRTSLGYAPTQNQTQLWNVIGQDAGLNAGNQQSGNIFENAWNGFKGNIEKRAKAAENAIGTTGAVLYETRGDLISPILSRITGQEYVSPGDAAQRNKMDNLLRDNRDKLNEIYRNAGYNSSEDYYAAKDAVEKEIFGKYGFDSDAYWNKHADLWSPAGITPEVAKLEAEREAVINGMSQEDADKIRKFDAIQNQLKSQTASASENVNNLANQYRDYRENNYVGKKINQDRGKFLGDAMTTVSTGADIAAMTMGMPMGVLANTVQGGVEGLADELSQNGFENFDWGRAGQNALIGAASGAATAGLSKGLGKAMAKNKDIYGMDNLVFKPTGMLKRAGNAVLKNSAGRGAVSGALGGAVGGGLGAAMNGQDVLEGALSGAGQGAATGAVSGAIMGTANKIGNKIIDSGLERAQARAKAGQDATLGDKAFNKIREIQTTGDRWTRDANGNELKSFKDRWNNAVGSGKSTAANFANAFGEVGSKIDDKLMKAAAGSKQGFVAVPSFGGNDDENVGYIKKYQNQGMGIRKATDEAYKDLVRNAYDGDERGYEGVLEDVKAAGYPNETNYQKAQRFLQGGGMDIYPEDMFESLRSVYGPDFKESTYKNKDGSWKVKNGEYYVETMYKNQIAQRLAKDMDAMDAGTYQKAQLQNKVYDLGQDSDGNQMYGNINPDDMVGELKNRIKEYEGLSNYDELKKGTIEAAYESGLISANERDELRDISPATAQTASTAQPQDAYMKNRLEYLRNEAKNGTISYGELAELQEYAPQILEMGDTELAEWAGIPEDEFNAYQAKNTTANTQKVVPNNNDIEQRLDYLRKELRGGTISYGELAELQEYAPQILASGDAELAEAAGIPEDEFRAYQNGDDNITQQEPVGNQPTPKQSDSPTTIKEALKQAFTLKPGGTKKGFVAVPSFGKDKGNDYTNDINNMVINRNDVAPTDNNPETELYRALTGSGESGGSEVPPVQTQQLRQNPVDPWDNLAKEFGYATYNDAIRAFAQANPNTPISAGAVTTWLDNNAGDYNPNARQVAPQNPQGGVMAQEIQEAEIVPKRRYMSGEEIKARKNIVREITDQFDSPNDPTIRRTDPNETFYNMYDKFGFSDGNDIRQAIQYAEQGGLVPTMIREAAGKIGVVDLSDANKLVMDLKLNNKTLSNKTKYVLDAIIDASPSTIEGNKNGVDALQLQRTLEKMASDAKGTNGTYRIGNQVVDELTANNMYRIADSIGKNLDDAAVQSGVVQEVMQAHAPEIQQMRNAFPDNQKWQKWVDNLTKATTIKEMRSSIKDPTRASIYIHNADERVGSVGNKTQRGINGMNVPTTDATIRNRIVNWGANKLYNSAPARQARIEKNQDIIKTEQAKQMPALTQTPPVDNNATTETPVAQTASATSNPQTQIYDMFNRNNTMNIIGRNIGEQMGESQRPIENYLQEASAEAGYMPPLAATTSTYGQQSDGSLESLANGDGQAVASSSNYYGPGLGGYYSSTGNGQVDVLGRAMELAMDAGDAAAFGTLYQMYSQAVEGLQDTSNPYESLTVNQQNQLAKIETAEDAIDQMEQLLSDASGAKGGIKGTLQSWAGNIGLDSNAKAYNDMVSGFGNDISKVLGKQNMPQITDDAQTAATKIQTLRDSLARAKANYYRMYGLI